jgi:hypothetical protein
MIPTPEHLRQWRTRYPAGERRRGFSRFLEVMRSVSAGDRGFVRRNQSQATELATTIGTGTRVRGAGIALGSKRWVSADYGHGLRRRPPVV